MTIPSQVSVQCKYCSQEFSSEIRRGPRRSVCDDCKSAYRKQWEERNPLNAAKRVMKHRKLKAPQMRTEIYERLGGAFCTCCGITESVFLTIDHINEDGYKDRKRNSKGNISTSTLSRLTKIMKEGCPRDRYQVLCFNCNTAKHRNNGICPHKEKGVTTIPTGSTAKWPEAHNLQ